MSIKSMNATELNEILNANEPIILIDCREQHEWDEGRIEKAIHIPLGQIEDRLSEIPDKNAKIVIQCRSGKRSMRAAELLDDEGYSDLTNLEGGIFGWQDNNLKIIKG